MREYPFGRLRLDPVDLFFVEQEFSGPDGVMVHDIPMGVRADMAIQEEDFGILYYDITVFEIGLAVTQGFDLSAGEQDACLKGLFNGIVVKGLSVLRYDFHRKF